MTGISKSALGSYEKEDYKEINHGNLITLADFYGVSVDYLLCRTENREQINTPLTELHLNDEMVALLKSGRINNRLLCELATHKDFIKFLADIEIYVDGIATMQIQNLNALVDTVRHEIIERYRPGEDDPHLKVLQAAHISDDEYFSQMVRDDLNLITIIYITTTFRFFHPEEGLHQIIFRNTHPTRKNGRLYTKYICHFEKHLLFWSPNPTFILGNANIPIQAEPHHSSKFFLSHSSKNPYFFDTLSNGHRLHLTLGKLSIHFFVSCPKCTYDTSCCQIRICCLYFLSAASDCFKSRKSFLFHVHQKVRYRQLTQINTFFRGVPCRDRTSARCG